MNPTAARRAAGMPHRAVWGLVAQALSSASNLLIAIYIARTSSAPVFGQFSVLFSILQLALIATRAFGPVTLTVAYADTRSEAPTPIRSGGRPRVTAQVGSVSEGVDLHARSAVTCSAILAIAPGLLLAVSAGWLPLVDTTTAILFAFGLPVLAAQDAWRLTHFAAGRPRRAALTEAVWLGTSTTLFVTVHLALGAISLQAALGLWILGAAASLAVSVLLARGVGERAALTWFRAHRRSGFRFLAETGSRFAPAELSLLLLAPVLGATGLAGLRAGQLAFGPLNLVLSSMMNTMLPEFASVRHAGVGAGRRLRRRAELTLAGGTVVYGVTLLLLPAGAGAALFGDSWSLAEGLLAPLALAYVLRGLVLPATLQLRTVASGSLLAMAGGVQLPIGLGVRLLGGWVGGSLGAAYGFTAAASADNLVTRLSLRHHLRTAAVEHAGGPRTTRRRRPR